jgi:outer membrane immunogenic protein
MTIKALIGVAGIALVIGAPALAADLPLKAPPAPVAIAYDWTGFYFGGHVGGAWGNKTWLEDATGSGTGLGPAAAGLVDAKYDVSGFLGGGQVGFNYQTGRIVWGIEADLSGASITGGGGACFTAVGPGNTCSSKTDWLGTVTGRLGYAFDRTLVYVKGGYAAAHDKYSNPFTFPGISSVDTATETRSGWTAGVGLEYALSGPWSVKAEYDYMGFGTRDLTFTDPLGGGYTENIRQYINEIKVGINYRFGMPGAVSTRY